MQPFENDRRYSRMLNDWENPQPIEPEPESEPREAILFQPGLILWLEGHQIGIYKMAVPEKGTHLVLLLGHGGSLRTQVYDLEQCEVAEMGMIPPPLFIKLQEEMRWYRDLIVFHCFSFDDTVRVPQIEMTQSNAAQKIQPREAAPVRKPAVASGLRRGQRIQIKFGQKVWQAVYWCKDSRGDVIAHQNGGDWALMHLDLKQYAASLRAEAEPDPALARAIEESLLKQ